MDKDAMAVEVRAARKAHGWTQAQLAAQAGYSERTIRNLEAGEGVDPKTAADVYRVLGFPTVPPLWPDDVAVFLDMVGYRLTRLDPPERLGLIEAVTRLLVEYRAKPA